MPSAENDAPRIVCTQGHTNRFDCCTCCGWGTNRGYACCVIPPAKTEADT